MKSNLVTFAESELARIEVGEDDDGMQEAINKDILAVVEVFSQQGHSGFSGSYAISMLEKLLRFEPITPLTGEDDEWNDIGEMSGSPMWQNKRCSHVFKNADGRAYDIQGKVFTDPDGFSYTSNKSKVFVTFPYFPVTKFVKVKKTQ